MRRAEVQPDDIAVLVDRVEILRVEYIGDGFDIAAEPRQAHRIEKAFAVGRINGVVDAVIRNRRRDGAREDAVQRVGAAQTGVLQRFEKQRGRGVEGFDVGAGQTVIQPNARERKLAQRILRENGEARAVLHVILDVLRVDADLLLEQDGFLLGLVKVIARRENRETARDGAVKKIRLGKAKHKGARQAPKLRGER